MRSKKHNQFDSAATVIVLCLFAGAMIGAFYGAHESDLIAEQIGKYRPLNAADGLRKVKIGYTALGIVVGILIGSAIAVQRYYKTRI